MRVELSVVVPVYRNAATLRELHARITRCVSPGGSYEIIYVNDACPATSLDVLRELEGLDRNVILLDLAHNVGQNRAVLSGLALACGDIAVVLDADLQDPPEAIPILVSELRRRKAAAVFAARRGKYESVGRLASARLFRWVLRHLPGTRLPEGAGLFVAMDRDLIAHINQATEAKPYVVGMIGRAGFSLAAIPVERLPNPHGESSYDAWKRVKLAAHALTAGVRAP
jgi:glycosyltransferase involved in cell wall biosynthesis